MALWSRYTQYFPPNPVFTETSVPSLAGKVLIVTGGNAGVGFELCRMLYERGGTVYMGARSKERANAAIESIVSSSSTSDSSGRLIHLPLDLNDLASVREAVKFFSERESKLDVLWNNAAAGAFAVPKGAKTAQSTEAFIGVHCVGPLYLSKLLLPQLRAAAAQSEPGKVRVIWTGSILIELQAPDGGVDYSAIDEGLSDPTQNYAASKAGNLLFASEWARRYGNGKDGILSVVANPGNLKTNLFQNTPKLMMMVVNLILYHAKYGAWTELWAGLSPELTMENEGAYILPWGRIHPSYPREDLVSAQKLEADGGTGGAKKFWEWCENKHRQFESS